MLGPNFFVDLNVLNCLLGRQYDLEALPAMDLTIALLDQPFWFSLKAKEKTFTFYTQTEMYSKDESLVISKGSVVFESVQVTALKDIDNMYLACRNLSLFAKENGLDKLWGKSDPEHAGILLIEKNGSINWKLVYGGEQLKLTIERLFGGTIKMRPNMEDFWNRCSINLMSLDEKIEKGESGDKFAMAQLAQAFFNGNDETEQDPEKAAYWFRKEAELQDAEGAFNLGLLYAKGFGVERDLEKAAEWMEKAVAWGYGDSDGAALAGKYRTMADGLKKAQAGDADAMADLAGSYMAISGSLSQAGPDKDYEQSLYWAQRAVEAGSAAGYFPLALAYEHGRGVQQDDAKAVEFYRKGAELGHAVCQHSYGCRLITGQGVEKNVKQALKLFEKSADQGFAPAYQALGQIYETGNGVEPDFDKEMEYYEKACESLPENAAFLHHVGYQYTNLMDWGDESRWQWAVERGAYWLHKSADLGEERSGASADIFDRILELHKQGKIPAGASFAACLTYLSGNGLVKRAGSEIQLQDQIEQQNQWKNTILLAKAAIEKEEKAFLDLSSSCKKAMHYNDDRIEKLAAQEKGLGLFSFKEKGALKEEIKTWKEKTASLKARIEAAQMQLDQTRSSIGKKIALLEAKAGTSFIMGKDPNPGGQPIKWFVTGESENKLHLLSEHILAFLSYPAAKGWIKEFPKKAFNAEERAVLVQEDGSYAFIPPLKDLPDSNQGFGATPSSALVSAVTRKVESMSYDSQLQRENLLKSELKDLQHYWLKGNPASDWACIASDSGIEIIGAYARYGVRPMIIIDLNVIAASFADK